MVLLRDGRTLIGYLRSVDQFANLVLHKTIERIHVGKEYGDIPRGIFIIRGENVVLLGEIVSIFGLLAATHLWHSIFCCCCSKLSICLLFAVGPRKGKQSTTTRDFRRRYFGFTAPRARTTTRKASPNLESTQGTRFKC